MSQWEEIRSLARQRHAEMRTIAGNESASALLAAAEQRTQVKRQRVHAGDPLLDGGEAMLDPEVHMIWFNCDVQPDLAIFYQAHEYAHLWIDGARATCHAGDVDGEASEERIPLGVQRVEGYSPHERRECQANVFAREFLLPADTLRRWFIEEGLDGMTIATRVGVLENMVFHQLAYALLTPDSLLQPLGGPGGDVEGPLPNLDPSQQKAAYAAHGPLLVDAGPGTGKTKTLTGRISFLLQAQGVEPSAILALTFSNKAAEEIRERVARVAPAAAPHIWMGTFHAFGLELLRKYGTRLGLPSKPAVLDPTAALFLLERLLPSLRLHHYQNLYEPTIALRDILQAISRAKDELVTPAHYTTLATAQLERATTAQEIEAAEKALEVAHVYTGYQEALDHEQLLDFGDLIFKSVLLLQSHADVCRAIHQTYRHILVDEYQDVNRASGILLRAVTGTGDGLWVVGDVRQAIYRFRGAAPSNMHLFPQDFPGADVLALTRNYRSQPRIVDAFATLAPRMRAMRNVPFTPWEKDRPDLGGHVFLGTANDLVAEGAGLACEIKRQQTQGIPYRDQAVLCRSHTHLARIADILEREGIPVLYLGDIFERPEVRDLLSLVSFACEGHGHGLVRIARFPEYQIPLEDVRTLLRLAREQEVPFPRALALAQQAEAMSDRGKTGCALLERHLDGLCYGTSGWSLLVRYLFARSTYLRTLLADASVAGQQRRLALYQFLQFAHEQIGAPREQGEEPKRLFLEYVRRLELFGEEKQLRRLPDWADALDAVRLLTIHASKGLEFRAVYVPILGQGYFPARRQARPCPPPAGMLADERDDGHDEEEECLFFVALSRARDFVCLSRARRYGARNSNCSALLTSIAEVLPCPPDGEITWVAHQASTTTAVADTEPPEPPPEFEATALDRYITCPRQYYYEYILGLGGRREDSAYILFHRCVYSVLRWLAEAQAQGNSVDEAAAQSQLADVWATQGPVDHPYEPIYLRNATDMVQRAVQRRLGPRSVVSRPLFEVPLRYGRVRFMPDHVESREDGTEVLQRLRTGRISSSEKDKNIYALYQRAARSGPQPRDVEIVSLSTDAVEAVSLREQTIVSRLARYDEAILGILAGRFPPQPNERECPRCPHYFICPLAEDDVTDQ
jgi:DNA helicase-2/ATP-dependent DNA helicase PcrA